MIFNCQRKPQDDPINKWFIHQVEAPDAATARVMMYNRSFAGDWLDYNKSDVWSPDEWIAT